MTGIILPQIGKIAYYRAWESYPNLIISDELFALAHHNDQYFLLITKQSQKNITVDQARELAKMSEFVKIGMLESKKKSSGILETVLFEAESAITPSETDPVVVQDISLDQKVDRYLVRYEKEAIPSSNSYDVQGAVQQRVNSAENPQGVALGNGQPVQFESRKRAGKSGILESVLFEAPGDPPADDDGGLAAGLGGDLGGGGADMGGGMDDMGGGEPAPNAPPSPPVVDTPKMNMNNYTRGVARLIQNYAALLDPQTTILNRAREYIKVNYDEATAMMFTEIMETQFGITETPPERDKRDAPGAVGAIYSAPGG